MNFSVKITPRSEREAMISERVKVSEEFGEPIYQFRGETYRPRVIRLPIGVPVYRLENCRTFSAQQTEIARHAFDRNFFAKGQEVHDAQISQHKILLELAKRGTDSVTPIFDVLQKDGQRETILISASGVVVNGNRRLSAMRELLRQSDGSVDSRFEYVRCAVLPPDTVRDEIDDIEADLQARPETKLAYDWIGDARLIRRQVDKGRTTKQVADRLRRSKFDIENVLQALDEADLYLSEWLGRPGEYELVQDGQQIFGDIPKSIAKQNNNLKNASRAIAWTIFDNRDKISGRVYRLNRAFGTLAPKTLDLLEDRLNILIDDEEYDSVQETEKDDFVIDIEAEYDARDYTAIIKALRNTDSTDEKVDALVDACETAIELDKGQRNEQAALRALVQVNSKLASIDPATAGSETLPAMLKQIESIRHGLDKIEVRINARSQESAEINREQGS